MIIPIKTQLWLNVGSVVIVLVATVVAISNYWVPSMTTARTNIQQNTATVTAIERQQVNIIELARQLTERQAEQGELDQHLWAFSNEDDFFERWDTFGQPTSTTIDIDSVADIVPSSTPVQREAVLVMTGSLPNVLATIAKLPTITPLVTLQQLQLSPGQTAATVSARLTVASLWYDDSLR